MYLLLLKSSIIYLGSNYNFGWVSKGDCEIVKILDEFEVVS